MSEKKMTSIGGQAVIEGVMMRGPHKIAVAVRKPDGEIIIDEKPIKSKSKFGKFPIIRGVVSFFGSMVIGVQALMFSAKFFDVEDEEIEKDKKKDDKIAKNEQKVIDKFETTNNNKAKKNKKNKENKKYKEKNIEVSKNTKCNDDAKCEVENINKESINIYNKDKKEPNENGMPDWALYLSVFISLAISVAMFFVLPNAITELIVPNKVENAILYNFIESIVKLIIFGAYIVLVSQMKDIQRVFEYHGAEHKSIFCYENGEELTVENVKKYTRFHPRCGTSFLLFVVIVSILVFSLLGVHESFLVNIGLRLLFLPIVAGISYEIIKFAGKSKSKWVTWLNVPGEWLQKFTTREPDDSQIEVAIASLKAVIPANGEDDKW